MRPNIDRFRTQQLFDDISLTALDLRFERIPLTPADPSTPAYSPWGFSCGQLALHPVYALDNDDLCRWRVSAVESGAAIADWERADIALGFMADLRQLDWSGGPLDAPRIVERNAAAVMAAHKKWTAALYGE